MHKIRFLSFIIFLCSTLFLLADDITGFWQTIDRKTKKPTSVIAIYAYQGSYYGRIVASYNQEGVIDDTIYHPESKATGIVGHPYYSGLDIVWDVKLDGDDYSGHVIDPRAGKVYRAELWREGANLILRGKLFIFGRNEVWPPFPESGFNENFKKPDVATFIPAKPEVID